VLAEWLLHELAAVVVTNHFGNVVGLEQLGEFVNDDRRTEWGPHLAYSINNDPIVRPRLVRDRQRHSIRATAASRVDESAIARAARRQLLTVVTHAIFNDFERDEALDVRGMTTVDRRVNDLMTTLSASRWDLLTKIQLPNAVPYIFAGLKVAVPLSVIGAVVAEFMQSDSGLGYVVLVAVGNVNTPMVFVAVLVMAFLSLGLFAVVSLGEWLVMRGRFNYLTIELEN